MARRWGFTIGAVVVFLVIAFVIIISDELPCSNFPSCPLTPVGFWAAIAFIVAGVLMGLIRGLAGGRQDSETPPRD